jgi:putative ABC transport system permease protein
MLASIITFIFRSFSRNLSYFFITMISLTVGITAAILMFVWVNYEIGYNSSLPDRERVFALLTNDRVEGSIITQEGTNVPLMDFLTHELPEIESVTRIDNSRGVLANGKKSVQKRGVYADSTFFKVHSTSLLVGNAAKPLPDRHSIAISKQLSDLLFVADDALGKTIIIDQKNEYTVTAIYNPFPDNSSFSYIEFILPYRESSDNEWVNYDLKLVDPTRKEQVEKKIDKKFAQLSGGSSINVFLFPVKDWRLHWNFENGKVSGGRIEYVIIFSITGIFILIMACINYVNISTARATRRTREIGVRKMTGATQHVLMRQFMTESMLVTSMASLISLMLAYMLLPYFNQLILVKLSISFADPMLWIGLLSISVLTAVMAGGYPAFLLSSFKPAVVLRGNLYSGLSGAGLRKALVVFQLALSVIIIFCSFTMWQQTDYLLNKDVGYDKHRIVNIWLDGVQRNSLDNLRSSLLTHTSIEAAAFSGASPMEINGYAECNRVASPRSSPLLFYGANIDANVLGTLNFKITQGRNFSEELASDSSNFIITQKAADLLGFDNPIGERISYTMFGPQQGEIIGVIKDFQNDDIHTAEKPVVFVFGTQYVGNLLVRYQEGKLEESVSHIRAVFEKFQPGIPINYSFLDTDFEDQLSREKQLGNMSVWFTMIAITIACLGLFGLVMFTTQRRTKEIGIRKVLGATVRQVVVMLCGEFVSPVLYSLGLAFPIAYFLMLKFLQGYPSHIAISINSFVFVGTTIVMLVLITMSYQSLKAARQNPTESLKLE